MQFFACFVPSVGVVLQVALETDHGEEIHCNALEQEDDKDKNNIKINNYDKKDTFYAIHLFGHERDVNGFFFWAARDVNCRLRIGGKPTAEGTPSHLKGD